MSEDRLRAVSRPEGLYLPGIDLFLDPSRPVKRAFVSHAHGDHFGFDSNVAEGAADFELFASAETAVLLERRFGTKVKHALAWGTSLAIETPEGSATVRVEPAGHILGAAQLVVDTPEGRLVYTGDYMPHAGFTHPAAASVPCDVLVVESTFGLPIFRFPPAEVVRAAIVDWCKTRLARGEQPVLLAYALGKSQELVCALGQAGLPVMAHGAIHRMCPAYSELGVAMPEVVAYDKTNAEPTVLLVPPRARTHPMVKKRKRASIGYVSGWALVDAARERYDADAVFPLSDHADFEGLLAAVERSSARKVYVTHGVAEPFASILRDRNIDAASLLAVAVDEREQAREDAHA